MSSHKISSSQRFATTPGPKAEEEYGLLADEMKGDFFGPMPVSEFLSSFMQKPRKNPPKGYVEAFKTVPKNGEPGFEDGFVSLCFPVNCSHMLKIYPFLRFVLYTKRNSAPNSFLSTLPHARTQITSENQIYLFTEKLLDSRREIQTFG